MSGVLALGTLVAAGSHAEEKTATTASTPAPSEQKIADSLKKLVFVPHDKGAPAVTDTGGVRAISMAPRIELLAPERMARTLSPTPTLYWHISKAAPGKVRFTLIADDTTAIDPLLEIDIDGVDQEGIYGISLDDHGIALESGERYIWSIALSADGDGLSGDLIAQTVMEHGADPDLAQALKQAAPDMRAIQLAAEGYWYDTIETLSMPIETSTNRQPWQAARGRLLDQAGLMQAARFDRQQAEY